MSMVLVCCSNVGGSSYEECGEAATSFYAHNDSVCCYCAGHDVACGIAITRDEAEEGLAALTAAMEPS